MAAGDGPHRPTRCAVAAPQAAVAPVATPAQTAQPAPAESQTPVGGGSDEYDKGAALAAAGRLAEARAVFEAAARKDAQDDHVATTLPIFR